MLKAMFTTIATTFTYLVSKHAKESVRELGALGMNKYNCENAQALLQNTWPHIKKYSNNLIEAQEQHKLQRNRLPSLSCSRTLPPSFLGSIRY